MIIINMVNDDQEIPQTKPNYISIKKLHFLTNQKIISPNTPLKSSFTHTSKNHTKKKLNP
jgi:hypothetical protein